MSPQIQCPCCGMRASAGDRRQYRPTRSETGEDIRTCRNCGESFDVTGQVATAA